jgi:hypothetical protein
VSLAPAAREDRSPRGDDRGARDVRGQGARDPRHPGHERRDHVPLSRQADDEGAPAQARHPVRAVPRLRRRDEIREFAKRGGLPADRQAARRRGRLGHGARRRRRAARGRHARAPGVDRGRSSASRSSSRATRASTTRSPSAAACSTSSSRTTTRTCSRRCAPLDLARSSSRPTASTRPGYDEVKAMGRRVITVPRHRHQRDPHGVVLRAQGPQVLRDRLPPAGRRRGTSTPPATTSTSTGVGDGRRARPHRAAPERRFAAGIIALRPDRDGRIVGYDGVRGDPARLRPVHHRRPPAAPGTPTQPIEAGYMANAWIRMKHPDYDASARR